MSRKDSRQESILRSPGSSCVLHSARAVAPLRPPWIGTQTQGAPSLPSSMCRDNLASPAWTPAAKSLNDVLFSRLRRPSRSLRNAPVLVSMKWTSRPVQQTQVGRHQSDPIKSQINQDIGRFSKRFDRLKDTTDALGGCSKITEYPLSRIRGG